MKRRTTFAVILVMAGFAVIVGRLFILQVLDSPLYVTLSRTERERLALVEGARGMILSAEGRPLADNRSVSSLAADPLQIRKFENVSLLSVQLAPILGMTPGSIRRKISGRKRFVWIKHGITSEESRRIGRRIRGLYILTEKRRTYPYGPIFQSVVGRVRSDGTPVSGLEKGYNPFLKGKKGKIVREVSARGRSYFQTESATPDALSGNTIATTLIASLQEYAQDALDEEVRSVDAQGGIVVVMDPRTGAVLALATRVSGRWAGASPGVSLVYEPGSIFKLVTASAALNEHRVSPRDSFFCYNGAMPIPGGFLHDAEPYGTLTLGGILAHSSNIGISQVALRLGPDKFEHYIRAFGFGARTGIDFPGESRGFFRGNRYWSRRSLYTIAMGQEIGVTPIQLVTAVSAIANGGRLMRPYMVSRVVNPGGKVLFEHKPQTVRRVISRETSRTLLSMLTGVVAPDGTGANAAITGFNVAGKTGTAEVYDPEKHAYSRTRTVDSFVGILPVDNPRLVVLVVVIQPKGISWGGTVAAPLFRKVAEMALVHFRIPASAPGEGGAVARADLPRVR
ncbi:MAG: penicillin-binding protein 2 [Nitrospirae bacterium]|nr:penicillin-binding protein 2 [Nitrospirota bacterium]MCL5286191.1 penicillin-binding protein 2 [Nitrospirota bacterium]